MTILLMLIPLGLVILAVAVAVFIWAVRNGQYEDLEGEGERIFFDDTPLPAPPIRGEGRSRESFEPVAANESRVGDRPDAERGTTKAKP